MSGKPKPAKKKQDEEPKKQTPNEPGTLSNTNSRGFTMIIVALVAIFVGVAVMGLQHETAHPLDHWYQFIAPEYDFIIGSVDTIEVTPKTEFTNQISSKGLPVIIKNSIVKKWDAFKKWDPDYIAKGVPTFKSVQFYSNRTFYYYRGSRPFSDIEGVSAQYKATTYQQKDMKAKEFFSKIRTPPFDSFYYYSSEIDGIGDLKHDLYPIEPLMVKKPGFDPKESYKHRWTGVWIGPSGATTHNHYDIYENFYVQLRGRKRFILFPPDYYPNLYLYPFLHPGGQQSQVIFDDPEVLKKFPKFKGAHAVEAILEPGDVLYLPPLWFHHVTALDMSVSVSIWSRPQETINMWEVESQPMPISKDMSPDMKALALRIYLDIILGDVLGKDNAAPFVEALLEQRYQVLLREVPALFATDQSYCKDELGYSSTLEDEMRESTADLIKLITEHFKGVAHESVREIWLGNWVEKVALTATDPTHVAAFLTDYVSC